MKIRKLFTSLCVACAVLAFSCNSPFITKPRGYFNIGLPKHEYRSFDQPGYPYTFEYPLYANVVKDTMFFDTEAENPWWINIDFPQFEGRIYISYKSLGKNDFNKMINDAYNLTYKHSTKASSINDSLMETPKNIHGAMFKVGGNAATASQFFLTDSVNHFLRGALYFDTAPNEDSLQPVNDFLRQDMLHLINSFEWKKQ